MRATKDQINLCRFPLTESLDIVESQILRSVYPVNSLYKSIAGRYRPVRVADGPITARYRFIKNVSWVRQKLICCIFVLYFFYLFFAFFFIIEQHTKSNHVLPVYKGTFEEKKNSRYFKYLSSKYNFFFQTCFRRGKHGLTTTTKQKKKKQKKKQKKKKKNNNKKKTTTTTKKNKQTITTTKTRG